MQTDNIIREHLEEQFSRTSRFLWYEDKQMLKQGKYIEFAETQLKKARNIFWLLLPIALIIIWYGATNLIDYGANPDWFKLTFGLSFFGVLFVVLVKGAREYYTIKGSMSLLIKLPEEPSRADDLSERTTPENI